MAPQILTRIGSLRQGSDLFSVLRGGFPNCFEFPSVR